MTQARTTLLLSVVAAAIAASGCFHLAREVPEVERYVLGGSNVSRAPVTARRATGGAGLAIGVRRVDVAPYLASLAIVVRRADNVILRSDFQRWAENPSAGLTRAFAEYVAAQPGVRSVDVAPWDARRAQDVLVQLHVARLEGVIVGVSQGEGHLRVSWEILSPSDGALLARGETDHRAPGWTPHNYADLVTRLDAGLVVLATDVLACVARLGAWSPTPAPRTVTSC